MADERPPLPDFYAVLGVGFDATNDELRQAWRTAVKQWHPDTNRSPEAHGMMTRINEAWEVLGDPERRAEYDTLYFTLRAAIANEERKLREEERLERQHQERIRREERERQRRAEEAARKRAEEEEQRRKEQQRKERERREAEARRKAEREKREKERKEREQRERERRAAESRRKADLERKRREQERINKEREEQERAERLRRQREAEEQQKAEAEREETERQAKEHRKKEQRERERNEREAEKERLKQQRDQRKHVRQRAYERLISNAGRSGKRRTQCCLRLSWTIRQSPFWIGIVAGGTFIALLSLVGAVAVIYLAQRTVDLRDYEGLSLVETVGQGEIRASDGAIDCSDTNGGTRNVVAHGEFPRAEAFFVAPNVETWSVGFLYHSSQSGFSAATVRRSGEGFEVYNWTQSGSTEVGRRRAAFNPDILNSSDTGYPNSFRIEVSDSGSIIFVNNVALAHLPRGDLRPYPSPVHFCVGFFGGEPEYTVRYLSLRGTVGESSVVPYATRRVVRVTPTGTPAPRIIRVTATPTQVPRIIYVTATPTRVPRIIYVTATPTRVPRIIYVTATPRPTPFPTLTPLPTATPRPATRSTPTETPAFESRGSGTLRAYDDGTINCPRWYAAPAFIATSATYGGAEFSFEVPPASGWSIGLSYHNVRHSDQDNVTDAATFVFKEAGGEHVRAAHWTRVEGDTVSWIIAGEVSPFDFNSDVGANNTIAIRIGRDLAALEVNGTVVLRVSASELRPFPGSMAVCVGFLSGESAPYSIEYTGLRGWTE